MKTKPKPKAVSARNCISCGTPLKRHHCTETLCRDLALARQEIEHLRYFRFLVALCLLPDGADPTDHHLIAAVLRARRPVTP